MPRLTVPDRYRRGISALLSLDQPVFDELVSALERQPGTTAKQFELRDIVILGLEPRTSEDILRSILSLYRAWASTADQKPTDFADDIAEAVTSFDPKAESSESKARLRKILDIEPIARSSKAFAVLTDNANDFHEAKILTDIRYAFRSNPDEAPYGAVIVHLLKLSYHEEADHKSFFVTLDSEDLKQLKSTIERAEKKETHLRNQLELTQTHVFGTGDK